MLSVFFRVSSILSERFLLTRSSKVSAVPTNMVPTAIATAAIKRDLSAKPVLKILSKRAISNMSVAIKKLYRPILKLNFLLVMFVTFSL